ncbi:MAG: hypothetical protein ACYC35_02825 [Pirellulales bacterium]
MHRPTVGIIALVLLLSGATLLVWRPESATYQVWLSACLRVGAVMALVWLAHPQLVRLPAWMLGAVLLLLPILAWKPKLFLLAVPILILLAFLRPRAGRGR